MTRSDALYAETEGIVTDTVNVSFESTTIEGTGIAVGDWNVFGTSVANETEATNPDCPDPRICEINASSYSSPQWEVDLASVLIGTLTISSEAFNRSWAGCVGNYRQPDADTMSETEPDGPGQIPYWLGYYWAETPDFADPNVRWTYDAHGHLLNVDPFTDAWTPFSITHEAIPTIEFAPRFRTTLLSSATAGKRKVRLEMWVEAIADLAVNTTQNYALVFGGEYPLAGFVTWAPPAVTEGYDPAFATQIAPYTDNIQTRSQTQIWCAYRENPDSPGEYEFVPINPLFTPTLVEGSRFPAPSGLTESAIVEVSGTDYWIPTYLVYNLPRPATQTHYAKWEKDVDEWDGPAPGVSFGTADIVTSPGTVNVAIAATYSYDGIITATVKYAHTGGPQTWDHPVYTFNTDFTVEVIDFDDVEVTINPTATPMPQPASL
jgi:hypothetical protein